MGVWGQDPIHDQSHLEIFAYSTRKFSGLNRHLPLLQIAVVSWLSRCEITWYVLNCRYKNSRLQPRLHNMISSVLASDRRPLRSYIHLYHRRKNVLRYSFIPGTFLRFNVILQRFVF